jgi:conjugative transfer region lipoprotein (TIGR03751 family)
MAFPETFARATALSALGLVMAGCTVFSARESPLPNDGPTMTEVYRNHMATGGSTSVGRDTAAPGAADDRARTPRERLPLRGAEDDAFLTHRAALSDPLNNRFERLPNPDLTMFVFPHLAQGRHPVPGYTTVFPMYADVQYAMPGEVAPRHQAGGSFTYPAPLRSRMPQLLEDRADQLERGKREYYATLAKQAPVAARVLPEFDRMHTVRCGSVLPANELAQLASGSQVFAQMVQLIQQRRDAEAYRYGAAAYTCPNEQTASK